MTLREDRYRAERDEAREEVTSLREQVQLAKAVCEALELAQLATEQDREGSQMWVQCWNELTTWRATQKGGAR